MLNLPVSNTEVIIFTIFLLLWAGFLFGGFFIGTLNEDETRRMPLATRLLSSLMLVITAWIWFAISQGTPVARYATFLAIGMSFGFAGDIFMAQASNDTGKTTIIYGMAAFGIGHIAYIAGMMMVELPPQIEISQAIPVVAVWWLIAVVLWYLVVFRGSEGSTVIYLALPYAILLATTVAVAMILTMRDMSFVLVTIGAILFLLSDLILAAQLFNNLRFKYIGDLVWFTYGPGQMLIVAGVFLYTVIDRLSMFS